MIFKKLLLKPYLFVDNVDIYQGFVFIPLLHRFGVLLVWFHDKADKRILLLVVLFLVVDRYVLAHLGKRLVEQAELTLTILVLVCHTVFLRALTLQTFKTVGI